jgi:hypothetical protein
LITFINSLFSQSVSDTNLIWVNFISKQKSQSYTIYVDGNVTNNHGLTGYFDCWILRLDPLGNLLWQKTYGGSDHDEAYSIKQTSDGGFIFTGRSNSIDGDVIGGSTEGITWVVKISNIGDIEWQKSYGSRTLSEEQAYSIAQTADGGYIVAGECSANGGDISGFHGADDFSLLKLDASGTVVWQKSLGGTLAEVAHSVMQTFDGGYVVTGNSRSNNGDVTGNHGNDDYWVAKVSSAGVLIWQKSLGGNNADFGLEIQQTADSGFIVAGYTSSNNNGDVGPNHGVQDYWIIKLSAEGTIPVTLDRLDAIKQDKSVLCKWKTF